MTVNCKASGYRRGAESAVMTSIALPFKLRRATNGDADAEATADLFCASYRRLQLSANAPQHRGVSRFVANDAEGMRSHSRRGRSRSSRSRVKKCGDFYTRPDRNRKGSGNAADRGGEIEQG